MGIDWNSKGTGGFIGLKFGALNYTGEGQTLTPAVVILKLNQFQACINKTNQLTTPFLCHLEHVACTNV